MPRPCRPLLAPWMHDARAHADAERGRLHPPKLDASSPSILARPARRGRNALPRRRVAAGRRCGSPSRSSTSRFRAARLAGRAHDGSPRGLRRRPSINTVPALDLGSAGSCSRQPSARATRSRAAAEAIPKAIVRHRRLLATPRHPRWVTRRSTIVTTARAPVRALPGPATTAPIRLAASRVPSRPSTRAGTGSRRHRHRTYPARLIIDLLPRKPPEKHEGSEIVRGASRTVLGSAAAAFMCGPHGERKLHPRIDVRRAVPYRSDARGRTRRVPASRALSATPRGADAPATSS